MKICLLNCVDVPRSEVYDVGYYLSKKGHEVTIIYPKKGEAEESIHNGIRFISFSSNFFPKIHYTLPNLYREAQILANLVNNENYDVIQACEYDYLTSLGPLLIKKKSNISMILTNDSFPGITWKYGNIFVDSIGKIYTYSIGRFILNSYDILTFLYKDLAKKAEILGIEKEKAHVIPNGINLEIFHKNVDGSAVRGALNIKDNEKLLLFIGRLALVKRIDILIEITKVMSRDGFNIKTIIIGDGPYEHMYKELASSCPNILFLGRVDREYLPNFYAACDIFILPSLSEGLPTVLLEAAASGKPIVASDVGGIPDIVIHGETGFLAKPSDINCFIHYIRILLNDEDLAKKFGLNAYDHVVRNFNWADIIPKYERLYSSLK